MYLLVIPANKARLQHIVQRSSNRIFLRDDDADGSTIVFY